jgi:hypothetical protein
MHETTFERVDSLEAVNLDQNPEEDEVLVEDARAGLTPAQYVERKLLDVLRNSPLLVSRLQTSRPNGR